MSGTNFATFISLSIPVILLLTLGLAITSFGLIHSNTKGGSYCLFLVTETDTIDRGLFIDKAPICKLSLASSAIAGICLTILTGIELVRVMFQLQMKKYPAIAFQFVLFIVSIIFLIITASVVATGWGVSCKNLNSSSSFSCTGYQYSGLAQQGMSLVPHGGEIIAAAACSGIGTILCSVGVFLYIIHQVLQSRRLK